MMPVGIVLIYLAKSSNSEVGGLRPNRALIVFHVLIKSQFGPRKQVNRHVRLCVQRRLACSAGERPAGARVRSPVVWIAGWRETETLKPIDNVSLGKTTSNRAVTTVNAKVASKVRSPEGRVLNRRAKAAWGSRKLTDAAPSLRRGGSDSTVARTCRATGEALLAPGRNHRSRVDRITGSTGKSIDGERVADGSV